MTKVKSLITLLEDKNPIDEFEMDFEHNGKKAVAMFDVLDAGTPASSSRPGPYSDDPYGYEGEAPELKFKSAYYHTSDNQSQINDLSDEQIADLEQKASDLYPERQE